MCSSPKYNSAKLDKNHIDTKTYKTVQVQQFTRRQFLNGLSEKEKIYIPNNNETTQN